MTEVYRIDSSRLASSSKVYSFFKIFKLVATMSFIIIALVVFGNENTESKINGIQIVYFVFIGLCIIIMAIVLLVKPRDILQDYVVEIDYNNWRLKKHGTHTISCDLKRSDIGKVLRTAEGIVFYQKGYQSFVSIFDKTGNLHNRKGRILIPIEIEKYAKIHERVKLEFGL